MAKPSVVADVRSVLLRSLSEIDPGRAADCYSSQSQGPAMPFPRRRDTTIVDRAREVMDSLQTATVLSRLFPGTRFVVLTMPASQVDRNRDIEPLPLEEIDARVDHSGTLAGVIRTSLADEFPGSVPAAAEGLLAELGVIERQDRSYFLADTHDGDAVAGYNYRRRRRSDILSELLELKRSVM